MILKTTEDFIGRVLHTYRVEIAPSKTSVMFGISNFAHANQTGHVRLYNPRGVVDLPANQVPSLIRIEDAYFASSSPADNKKYYSLQDYFDDPAVFDWYRETYVDNGQTWPEPVLYFSFLLEGKLQTVSYPQWCVMPPKSWLSKVQKTIVPETLDVYEYVDDASNAARYWLLTDLEPSPYQYIPVLYKASDKVVGLSYSNADVERIFIDDDATVVTAYIREFSVVDYLYKVYDAGARLLKNKHAFKAASENG